MQYYDRGYFGEGITPLTDQVFVALTWRERMLLFIDRDTLEITSEQLFPNGIREGWGITNDNLYLYVTDGSQFMHRVDISTLEYVDRMPIQSQSQPVLMVNELELVTDLVDGKDYVWGNVFG